MQPERKANAAKERKRAVALVIYNKDRQRLLVVKRPPEDDRLPNVWGLPAATLRVGESYEAAAVRTGQEKLGVKIKILGEIGEATTDRGDHILHMKEFEVEVTEGTPSVPQPIITQPPSQMPSQLEASPSTWPANGEDRMIWSWQRGRAHFAAACTCRASAAFRDTSRKQIPRLARNDREARPSGGESRRMWRC